MKLASVSEIKNGLSAHLEMVRGGELVVVTDRNAPVATLERIAPGLMNEAVSRLVSRGVVSPPRQRLDLAAFFTLPRARCGGGLGRAILDEREEGR